MPRLSRRLPILAILGLGLLLRLGLAYVVFPRQGFASDLGLFTGWAETLARVGPGGFYGTAGSANYPPGYMYVLWLLGSLAGPLGSVLGVSSSDALALLLKLPPILADMAIAWLLFVTARRWFGGRAGLLAAAAYLFVPVTWYDSALWGQVDAVGALVMLAAVVLLVEGWSEPAAATAALAILVKPQDALALAIVAPVLVRRHVLSPGSGPAPSLRGLAARMDAAAGGSLGRLIADQGPVRLGTSALAAAVALIVPLLPFDIARFAPASLSNVPVIGHVAGLVGLFGQLGGEFSVLTANAYNMWSLVGPAPLASAIGAAGGAWTPDSIAVLGGVSAATIGAALLVGTGILVVAGLLRRDGRLPIVLALALLTFAFYALPTRVHERYLLPFFAPAALLAAGAAPRVLGYLGVGIANAINVHAVLGAALDIGSRGASGGFGGLGGAVRGFRGLGGGFGVSGSGGGNPGSAVSSISLPLTDLARSEPVVVAVALGQTAAFVVLLAAWLVVLGRPAVLARQRAPVAPAAPTAPAAPPAIEASDWSARSA